MEDREKGRVTAHTHIFPSDTQNMNLILSTDAKPRLKWTPELHQKFVEAVNQLGGADKVTPKSLMRVMGIHGLTLYHLKSHLQKYRLGKSQPSETSINTDQEECRYTRNTDTHSRGNVDDGTQSPINESLQISQALQLQMEVQRKLHEQIEVQRHLQLRIEAQGKYLQSVLKKAQQTLAGYSSSTIGLELAKAELSQLASMASSSISELTESGGLTPKDTERKQMRGAICSVESSLTSSESSGINEDKEPKNYSGKTLKFAMASIELPSAEETSNQSDGWKRNVSTISGGIYVEQPLAKRSSTHLNKSGVFRTIDLNNRYQNDTELGSKTIDLNCQGIEQFNGHY